MAKAETFDELKARWKLLPQGRRIIGLIGTIGVFVCLGSFFLAYALRAGFIVYLALTFLLFLCVYHGRYALEKNLTRREVRKIDYWYLTPTAIGLFLAAVNYSVQRDDSILRFNLRVYQVGEQPSIDEVNKRIASLSKFLCVDLKRANDGCAGIKRIAEEIRPGLSAEKISRLSDELTKTVLAPYARTFSNEQWAKEAQNLVLPIVIVQVAIDEWRDYANTAPKRNGTGRDGNDDEHILFALGQWVIWPFFLAYALALRITKVTIDVFEWAG